jgi:hypothetical protein
MARQSSIDLDSPGRPFDNIINFRDVGRSVNEFCGKQSVPLLTPVLIHSQTDTTCRILNEGILFRSARVFFSSD